MLEVVALVESHHYILYQWKLLKLVLSEWSSVYLYNVVKSLEMKGA